MVETPPPTVRLFWVDSLRSAAIVMMIAYHFCFDLAFFHKLDADFNHQMFWLTARAVIVSLFLALVGVSLALAASHSEFRRHFVRRQIRIGLCALAVSAASYAMFPQTFIFFGILHFIFVASLLGAAMSRTGLPSAVYVILGGLALWAGLEISSPAFDAAPLQWIGFMTHKPATEDYVPLFPWIGVVLLGIAAGRLLPREWTASRQIAIGRRGNLLRTATWPGRHSLAIYMLHQPVLLGVLYLLIGR
jgi:uncharacterized membrane protein